MWHSRTMIRRLVAGPLLVMVALCMLGGPAGAHGDKGLLAVDVAPPDAKGQAVVTARLAYANDGERVSGAQVEAAATGPGGATVAPVALAAGANGVYSGTLTLPAVGEWEVTVTAAAPSATGRVVVNVADGTTTSTAASGPASSAVSTTAKAKDSSSDSSSAFLTGVICILAIGGFSAWLVRRNVKRTNA